MSDHQCPVIDGEVTNEIPQGLVQLINVNDAIAGSDLYMCLKCLKEWVDFEFPGITQHMWIAKDNESFQWKEEIKVRWWNKFFKKK